MLTITGSAHLPQLVLIHGGGVGPWMWETCTPLLLKHYQLLIVSLPHHGDTTYQSSPFTIESYSHHLLQELKQYRNNEPIGLVGFSLGAQISLELLSLAPSYFSFAMINSALCKPMRLPFSLLKALAYMTLPLAKWRTFSKLQAKQLYISDSMFERYYALSSTMTAEQFAQIMHTNLTFTLKPTICETTTTIHITYGDKEISAIKKSASVLQRLLPSANTFMVSNMSHGFPLADAEAFSNYILTHYK